VVPFFTGGWYRFRTLLKLDAYADVIDTLMLQNVNDLKKKLSKELDAKKQNGDGETIDGALGLPDEFTNEDEKV
jgi:hypothetical protein